MAKDAPPALDHLRLLASAIAGQALEVAETGAGELAWTDGSTVFLPATASSSDRVRMLGVQASLVAAGSLDPKIVRSVPRRPQLMRRYLAVESQRALAANENALPPVVRSLLDRSGDRVETAEASLERARSRQPISDPTAILGTIHPRRLLAAVERATPVPSAGAAPGPKPAEDRLLELEDGEDDDENLGDLLSSPVGGGGPAGKLLRRLLSPARNRTGSGSPGADAATHNTSTRPGTGRGATLSTSPRATEPESTDFARPGHAYPEWDVHRRRYRPDWCTVTESDPSVRVPKTSAPAANDPDDLALRRALARLGLGLTHCRRQRQGDDIDIDAAVEARVDTLAGASHADDFYVESLRQRRDLAVLVLLDVSGSAGEPGARGKTVHAHQRAAASALTSALHALGDRVALYAFNSRGRQAVELLRVKRFNDHLDGAVRRRLLALAPGAYTRLGAAIRHGTTILDDHGGTPRRLLIVLSDGFAYDHGYEGRYGEADARRALVEARRRGIGCICLSVGADTEPAALQRVFGSAAHATMPSAERLPTLIGPLFRSALRSAEAQRRTFVRKDRTRERLDLERRDDDRNTAVLPAGR